MNATLLILGLIIPLSFNTVDGAKVMEMDRQLNQLILLHHATEAASFYADDFILTTSSGTKKLKADMVNEIKSPELVLEINETTDASVRLLDNTAILTGVLHQKGIYKGKSFDAKLAVTDTWVKTSSGWKLLAGHATLIK